MTHTADFLVIGGGLHGLAAALFAARHGLRVIIVERDYAGRHASGATAAGVRTLGRAPEELPLSLEAAAFWPEMRDLVGDDCGFRSCGQLQVAESDKAMTAIIRRIEKLQAQGMRHEQRLDANALRDIIPDLPQHCVGAAWVPSDGAADPHRALKAFKSAAKKAGVIIFEQSELLALSRNRAIWKADAGSEQFQAPLVLNAAGAWAGRVGTMAGEKLEHTIRTSMMLVTERARARVGPVVSSFGEKLSFKQTEQGTILIGGGAQGRLAADSNSAQVDMRALSQAARTAVRLFPWSGGVRIVRSWAGMEAMTEDRLPVLGFSTQIEGMIHAFGFSGHGFQLVPSVGRAIASLVAGEQPSHNLRPFSADRFQ